MFTSHLPVAGLDVFYPGLVLLGLATGMLTGLFGIGGGFIITPALRIIFGIPYPLAVGASLLQIVAATTLSTCSHWRRRNVDLKLGAIMAAGSLVGAEGGVRLLRVLDGLGSVTVAGQPRLWLDLILGGCYFVLLASVAAFMLRECLSARTAEPETCLAGRLRQWSAPPLQVFEYSGIGPISLWVPVGISLAVGLLAGLLGIGGGFVGLPLMIYLIGLPTRLAVGTSTVQVLAASSYGALRYAQGGSVDFLLAGWLILGALAGVKAGMRLSACTDCRTTRLWFAGLLALAALLVAAHLLAGDSLIYRK